MGKVQKARKSGHPVLQQQDWTPVTFRTDKVVLIVFPFGVKEMPLLQFDPKKYLKKGK